MHLKTDTSGANAHYAAVPQISHSRNSFSIAERHLTTMNFDILYPIWQKYIYPGDTLSISHQMLARLQTQIATLFDDLYMDVHAWYVPFRLLQKNWAEYQFNAQPLGPSEDNSALRAPYLTGPSTWQFASKSLYDYLGFPTLTTFVNPTLPTDQYMNAYLPLAYNLIWNLNYRDENLQNPVYFDNTTATHAYTNFTLLKRGKRHDLFTSCQPFQQKGPAATIPITGGQSPVKTAVSPTVTGTQYGLTIANAAGGGTPITTYMSAVGGAVGNFTSGNPGSGTGFNGTYPNNLYADLSLIQAFTVNTLRQSVAVQHLLENDARGGTRDVESIKHRWGVTVPDFRLNRPEYLGGSTFSFDGHVVPQTSATNSGSTPQGHLTQFSQTMNSFNLTHSFPEHGVVILLLSARSNITYQQGLPKEFSYRTRLDWYQPEFANLGEVAVKYKEIMYGAALTPDATFGYQEYGYELRYGLNRVSSEMRSNYPQSLDSWHMATQFATLPALSGAFIESATPIDRNIAVAQSVADSIQLNMMVKGTIARTLPMYSIPGLTRL